MISASLPGEALAQLGQLSHLYPPPAPAGMTPEFLAPPPRPYARYPPRRRDAMPAPQAPAPPFPSYTPFLPHGYASYLYRARALPQPPAAYPMRPRPTSGFVPPPPAPHSPPTSAPAPVPPPREEPPMSPERGVPTPYFCRGALIRLEDGSLRRVEEMRTEDFVMSADRSGDLALTQCTLLRLEERADKLALTLTYDRNRSQMSRRILDLDNLPDEEFEELIMGINDEQAENSDIGGDSDPDDVLPQNLQLSMVHDPGFREDLPGPSQVQVSASPVTVSPASSPYSTPSSTPQPRARGALTRGPGLIS